MASITEQPKTVQEEEEAACTYAMQLVSSSVLPMTLKAAIELDILETIAGAGPGAQLSPAEIAAHLSIKNPEASAMLDRMLRLLASYSVLTCSLDTGDDCGVQRRYGQAPVCKYLTKNKDGVSMAPLCLMNQDKVPMESWYYLKDAVLAGGIPFDKAHGMTAFEFHGKDPKINKVFHECMANSSTIIMKNILERYEFKDVKVLVDVGGGKGASLSMITSKYPHIKGINFDLPHAVAEAPAIPGVEHVGGDMFASVPSGDAILLKWVLHDWSEDHCLKLLKNCWMALPEFGKVIVMDGILPIIPDPTPAAQAILNTDMIMMTNPGGKERTEKEFESLAKKAGFSGFIALCCFSCVWVMEFYK